MDAGIPPFGGCYTQPRVDVSVGEVSRKMPGLHVCPLYLLVRIPKLGTASSQSCLSGSDRSGRGGRFPLAPRLQASPGCRLCADSMQAAITTSSPT